MDLIAEIRRRHLVRHEGISSIARDLKMCRGTARLVRPLVDALAKHVMAGDRVHGDDTYPSGEHRSVD